MFHGGMRIHASHPTLATKCRFSFCQDI
jgi:hypothetical protein